MSRIYGIVKKNCKKYYLEVADLAIRTVDLEDDAAHHLDQELVDVVRVVVEGLCLEFTKHS